jgi:hypothetical protein
MRKANRLALIALALTGACWLAIPGRADDAAMEPIWKQYWMAVAAVGQCEDRKFTGPEYDAMTHVINKKVNYEIGAGARTHLIDDAKDEVWDRVFKYGCKDPQIVDLLALYHTQLEPALPY